MSRLCVGITGGEERLMCIKGRFRSESFLGSYLRWSIPCLLTRLVKTALELLLRILIELLFEVKYKNSSGTMCSSINLLKKEMQMLPLGIFIWCSSLTALTIDQFRQPLTPQENGS